MTVSISWITKNYIRLIKFRTNLFVSSMYILKKRYFQTMINALNPVSVTRPRILGLISSLIYQLDDVDSFYQYLRQMEVATESSLISTRHCNIVKK